MLCKCGFPMINWDGEEIDEKKDSTRYTYEKYSPGIRR